MKRAVVFATVVLGGCNSIPREPAATEIFHRPFDKLGSCVFEKARERDGFAGVTYSDLSSSGRVLISRAIQFTELYEITFAREDAATTRVHIRVHPSVWGAEFDTAPLLAFVRECAAV